MILRAIRAENVLKYRSLSIELGERKLIGVLGPNESGKSTIGETICFALFGRSFATGPAELHKLVRWGENHCSATLEFSVGERRYTLSRQLDRDGHHSARLARAEAPDDPVARGPSGVGEALGDVLGFGYEEFVESFYLPQREILSPDPHSQSVRNTAGVARLEQVGRELRGEIANREGSLAEIRTDREAVERDLAELAPGAAPLPALTEERRVVADRLDRAVTLAEDVETRRDEALESTERAAAAQRSRRRALLLCAIALPLALVAAGSWALLVWGGRSPAAEALRTQLARALPGAGPDLAVWIGAGAAVLGVVFLAAWLRAVLQGRRVAALREQAGRLEAILGEARETVPEEATGGGRGDAGGPASGAAPQSASEPVGSPPRPGDAELQVLRDSFAGGLPSPDLVRSYAEREAGWLRRQGDHLRDRRAVLDVRIAEAEDRKQRAERTSKVLEDLDARIARIEGEIADRRRGLELLQGATVHLSHTFNRDVRESIASLLPRFTDDRYEYLQLDDDLTVRVFSRDKRDFMDLDEISGGTQRQIMLALRLALSRSLLSRIGAGSQFVFLDEPFAFFDDDRACRTLRALAGHRDDLGQVWIVGQDFPQSCAGELDLEIRCDRPDESLSVSG